MKKTGLYFLAFAVAIVVQFNGAVLYAQANNKSMIVVDQRGGADFVSIQDALNSLPDAASAPRIIYIKAGVIGEKMIHHSICGRIFKVINLLVFLMSCTYSHALNKNKITIKNQLPLLKRLKQDLQECLG